MLQAQLPELRQFLRNLKREIDGQNGETVVLHPLPKALLFHQLHVTFYIEFSSGSAAALRISFRQASEQERRSIIMPCGLVRQSQQLEVSQLSSHPRWHPARALSFVIAHQGGQFDSVVSSSLPQPWSDIVANSLKSAYAAAYAQFGDAFQFVEVALEYVSESEGFRNNPFDIDICKPSGCNSDSIHLNA